MLVHQRVFHTTDWSFWVGKPLEFPDNSDTPRKQETSCWWFQTFQETNMVSESFKFQRAQPTSRWDLFRQTCWMTTGQIIHSRSLRCEMAQWYRKPICFGARSTRASTSAWRFLRLGNWTVSYAGKTEIFHVILLGFEVTTCVSWGF